jgi:hypothetical protein
MEVLYDLDGSSASLESASEDLDITYSEDLTSDSDLEEDKIES